MQTPHSGRAAFPGANGDIAFGSDRVGDAQIFRVPGPGGEAAQLTTEGDNTSPTWSPDGTRIAFISTRDGDQAIYVMNADGTNETRLTDGRAPAWSADGSKIAFIKLTGPEGSQHYAIFTVNAGGGSPVVLIDSAGEETTPAFSSDGTKIAYGHADLGEDHELYVADADGSNPMPLTDNPATDYYPDWSPDGSRIVYQCGGGYVCVIDADGNNQQTLPPTNGGADYSPVWSPDGSRIAVESYAPEEDLGGIYTMKPDGSDIQVVTHEGDFEPDWQSLPAPSSTPTATPTPTPTPTSSPSGSPGPLAQGDVDCSGGVTSVDALKELRHVAQLSVSQNEPCPDIGEDVASVWGDVDCNGQVTSVDALKILRHVADLSVGQNEPCPDIGIPEG